MGKTISLAVIFTLFLFLTAIPSATAFEILIEEDIIKKKVTTIDLVPTVDNFIILFDASGSTANKYKDTGQQIIDAQKKILRQQNAVLPELGFNAGLYTFTPFKAYYEMQPYRQAEFAKAIDSLPTAETAGGYAGQPTPLAEGITELDPILSKFPGRTAILIFTDGSYTYDRIRKIRPLQAAQKLAGKYDVAFYLLSSASEEKNIKLLEAVASINASSRVIPFDAVYNYQIIGAGVLYVVKATVDIETETDVRIAGVDVDNIEFGFDSTEIPRNGAEELDELGDFMQNNPNTYAVIAGFSDDAGDKEYNMVLSRNRAERAAAYLIQNHNIEPYRIVALWYGPYNPIDTNDTPQGRARNRRVEIVVGSI